MKKARRQGATKKPGKVGGADLPVRTVGHSVRTGTSALPVPASTPADLSHHPLFREWVDPASGVLSYVLTSDLAPILRNIYYVTPTVRDAGRWLWFHAYYPPSKQPQLAVVSLDPQRPVIRAFPQAVVGGNSLVTPEGDAAYAPIGDGVYHVSQNGETREVFRLPNELLGERHLFRLVTDLTASCDGKQFLLDSHIGNRWLISLADVATGAVRPLRWFASEHYHAAFSLHDPELFMVNLGQQYDPLTGDKTDMNIRTWIMDTGLRRYEPMDPSLWFHHNCMGCHEWWTAPGKINWCDYNDGIYEIDLATRRKELIWRHPLVHGQCDASARYYCGDQNPYHWNEERPCSVWFYDRRSGREIAVVSHMPAQPLPWGDFRAYHIDPHPHFSEDGEWLVYTTTALGRISVALCPVRSLREATAEKTG